MIADLQAAAPALALQLVVVNASTDRDLETAFATFSQRRVGAVLVGTSTLLARRTEQLAALAARHALPAMFAFREQWVPPTWHLYRARSQRRETSRSPGRAGYKNRADPQPQNSEGTWHHLPDLAAGSRRRGH
jgi:hypothetical protein